MDLTQKAFAVALAGLVLAACAGQDSRLTSTYFDGHKELILFAAYSANAGSVTVQAFADVPAGTPGTMEIRGPFHVRCEGQFQGPDPNFSDPSNLPFLDVGVGHLGTAGIRTPSGSYTAVVAIPSRAASLSKTFQGGGATGNEYQGLFDLPDQCVPVADSAQQFETFVAAYLAAMSNWAGKMDPSQVKSQLLALVAQAKAAFSAQDSSTTLGHVTEIKDTVAGLDAGRYPYTQLILRAARNSIALLTQPIPAP